jgi:hypothetical protein
VLLFQTYNIILYVHAFLFCWHFSYRTCAFCKAPSDWLQLPLAALQINRHRVTSKISLTMPRVMMSRADRNHWLAKMPVERHYFIYSLHKLMKYKPLDCLADWKKFSILRLLFRHINDISTIIKLAVQSLNSGVDLRNCLQLALSNIYWPQICEVHECLYLR